MLGSRIVKDAVVISPQVRQAPCGFYWPLIVWPGKMECLEDRPIFFSYCRRLRRHRCQGRRILRFQTEAFFGLR